MKDTDVKPPASSAEPDPSVELVGFGPSLRTEGRVPANPAIAAALARRRRLHKIVLIAILVFVALATFLGPKVYRGARHMRAAGLAHSAEIEAAKGQIDEAVATVRTAYLMAPDEPHVVRAMAKILTVLNAPSATVYWNWVLASSSVTDQDRRDAAESALRLGLYTQAGMIIKDLLARDGNSAPNLLMAGRYYSYAGAPSEALSYGTRALEADPNYEPAIIFLAVQKMKNPYLRQEGIDALLKLTHDDSAIGFLAIQRLAQEPGLKPAENQELLDQLQAHHPKNGLWKVTALVLQLKLHPEQHDALLKQFVSEYAQAGTNDQIKVGGWLNSAGESKWVFDLTTQDKALANKDLFLVYLDALGNEQQWDKLESLLNQPRLPLETAYVELYLFRAAREKGEAEAADLHWRAAQVAASHSPRQSLYLASYAENIGDLDRAEPVYRMLTQDVMAGRSAYLGLIRIYQSRDTQKTRDLLDEMTARWPQDEAIANDDIYYNLLLNTKVPEMCKRAVALAKSDVHSAPHLTDVALAYLRMNAPGQALKVLNYGHIDWKTATAATRVVAAAALKATGHEDTAVQMLAQVNRGALHPEEAALIKNIP